MKMKFMKIARRITGDINKSIVYYSKLGIFQSFIELDDINKLKNNFVRNTKVNNEISFGEKANVKIYNVSGSLVKSASVEKNTSLNVSSLPKGIYVVTGEVNGQSVSQKIVKE